MQQRPARTEADSRAAISRAYYAAFCTARNLLLGEGVSVPPTGKSHTIVVSEFQSHSGLTRKAIGANLARLRMARNRVDYRDRVPQVSNQVRASLYWADQILADLRRV